MIEETIYLIAWTGAIFYSLQRFIFSCKGNHHKSPIDYTAGLEFFNRPKDNSDVEWNLLTSIFKTYWMFFLCEVFGAQVILRKKREILPYCYGIYSTFCLSMILGFPLALAVIGLIIFLISVSYLGRRSICYLITVLSLLFLHSSWFSDYKALYFEYEDSVLVDLTLGWLLAKGLSFSVDRIESGLHKSVTPADISMIFSYSLHLPSLFSGPIISYDKFQSQMRSNMHSSPPDFLRNVFRLGYTMSFYFLYELLLHYVYSSAVQFQPETVAHFDSWTLTGLGYALPMMFFLKYYIIYGVAGRLALLEGFELPKPPKCISAIHLSSTLWRSFDPGLYLWLKRYIYLPVINGNFSSYRRVLGLMVCFSFVALWHGLAETISISCALNCMLVTSEQVMQFVSNTDFGKKFEKNFSPMAKKRIKAAISMPHFLMMCISCDFFLSNFEIGKLLIEKIILGGLIPLVPVMFFMYCGCHVSMNVRLWEKKISS